MSQPRKGKTTILFFNIWWIVSGLSTKHKCCFVHTVLYQTFCNVSHLLCICILQPKNKSWRMTFTWKDKKFIKEFLTLFFFFYHVLCERTTVGSGGGSRVTPVTPDSSLPGAIDAHWVAPHLDKIDGSRTEACQPTWCLVTSIIHHLSEGTKRQRG